MDDREDGGPVIRTRVRGGPTATVQLLGEDAQRRALLPGEAMEEILWTGGPEAAFQPSDGRSVSGAVIHLPFIDSAGRRNRVPFSGKVEFALKRNPPKFVLNAWLTPDELVFLTLLDQSAPVSTATDLHVAASKHAEAWAEVEGFRPLEYLPGKWRGGLVVDSDANPLGWTFLPWATVNGERRSTWIFTKRVERLPSAAAVIAAASRLEALPPIAVPKVDERPVKRSGLGGFLDVLGGR